MDEVQTKVKLKKIAIAFIAIASLGILICIGLLIQAYILREPAFELPLDSSFNTPENQLLGYFSFLFYAIGYLTLFLAYNLSKLLDTGNQNPSYISASIGTILIFYSFLLLYNCYKLEQEWWGYFLVLSSGIGYTFLMFSELVDLKPKKISEFLKIVGFVLMFVTIIFIFMDYSY